VAWSDIKQPITPITTATKSPTPKLNTKKDHVQHSKQKQEDDSEKIENKLHQNYNNDFEINKKDNFSKNNQQTKHKLASSARNSPTSVHQTPAAHERLYKSAAAQQAAQEKRRILHEEQRLAQFSFTPNINRTPFSFDQKEDETQPQLPLHERIGDIIKKKKERQQELWQQYNNPDNLNGEHSSVLSAALSLSLGN
jgi:hypothetical protein